MRIPIRKSGKFAHIKSDPHVTAEMLDKIMEKLERLKKVRPQSISEMQRLAEMGDFSENAAYALAKRRLRGINQRILELEVQIKNSILIKPPIKTGVVQLGSKVTIEIGGKQSTYLILGSTETSPGQGIISQSSPIGSALMGRRAGDRATFQSASKKIQCRITKIE